jgi:hypothetical protein
LKESGYNDPFSFGYSNFGRMNNSEAEVIRQSGSRPDISVSTPKKFKKAEMKDGKLIKHQLHNIVPTNMNFTELGITKIDDYSMTL